MLTLGHSNNDLLTHSADDIKMLSGKSLQGEAFFSLLISLCASRRIERLHVADCAQL